MQVLKQVTTIGRNWAVYGLNMGRTALESGADRLRATAEVLGSLSTKLAAPVENAEPHAEGNLGVKSAIHTQAEPPASTKIEPSTDMSH